MGKSIEKMIVRPYIFQAGPCILWQLVAYQGREETAMVEKYIPQRLRTAEAAPKAEAPKAESSRDRSPSFPLSRFRPRSSA